MQIEQTISGQARRRVSRLLWSVCILASVLGCQSPEPQRRPIEDLIKATIEFSVAEESRTAARPNSHRLPPQRKDAVRRASFEESHEPQTGRVVPISQHAPLQMPPDPEDLNHATGPELPNPVRTQRPARTDQLAGPLVNEIFEETDLRQAIQALATQAKASVIIDEQVGGTASALIEDEPFESALQKILLPAGFVWAKKDGQYFIGTTDPESSLYRFLSRKVDYRSQYFAPEELTALLPEGMKQYVRAVGKRNLMVIDAPLHIAQQILDELQHVDQPVPQVSLEAVVAVFSPESSFQYGMNLKQLAEKHAMQLDLSSLAMSGTIVPASAGYLFGKAASTSYFLRLLQQEGYVKIRAAPHVMAKDGEQAKISIERETFFATQPINPDFFYRQEIQKVQAGISLDITPVIRGDNITVIIERAEVSEDIRESGTDPQLASPYPLINRRTIQTTVNVKDGETIVIGGLTANQMVDRVSRVPFFSKIPLIGVMFKQVDRQQQEAEIVIFISPRIVYPGNMEVLPEHEPKFLSP
jgi:type IV pilus assembly protein PilQ